MRPRAALNQLFNKHWVCLNANNSISGSLVQLADERQNAFERASSRLGNSSVEVRVVGMEILVSMDFVQVFMAS